MSQPRSIYGFEGVDDGLSVLPSAARRALEIAGANLSSEGWRSLSQIDRMALVAAGAIETIDPEQVRSIVARALPLPIAVAPLDDPDPAKPPADLLRALGESKTISDARWASLRSLDRYTLSSAARSSTGRRLDEAYREIIQPLSHLGPSGEMRMVGVAAKQPTARRAVARARVRMRRETMTRLTSGETPKGDVFAAARVAGIQAAKRAAELIPLCHPLALTGTQIEILLEEPTGDEVSLGVRATVEAFDRTGVEMEALVAASVAALTIYDMLKSIDRWMTITDVGLLEKSGGRSGHQRRGDP